MLGLVARGSAPSCTKGIQALGSSRESYYSAQNSGLGFKNSLVHYSIEFTGELFTCYRCQIELNRITLCAVLLGFELRDFAALPRLRCQHHRSKRPAPPSLRLRRLTPTLSDLGSDHCGDAFPPVVVHKPKGADGGLALSSILKACCILFQNAESLLVSSIFPLELLLPCQNPTRVGYSISLPPHFRNFSFQYQSTSRVTFISIRDNINSTYPRAQSNQPPGFATLFLPSWQYSSKSFFRPDTRSSLTHSAGFV